jgi:tetratricopeptide (TPR) repeat protein
MPYGTDSSLWPVVIFWGGICLFTLWATKSRSSSEKQEDNKKEDAADPVKHQYDHQSKEKHDAGNHAYVLGRSYMDEGDNNTAVKYFTEAIDCGIQDANVFALRGGSLASLNRHHEAIKDFDKAIELNPNDCNIFYQRAYAKLAVGTYSGVESDMRQAIRLSRVACDFNSVYDKGVEKWGYSSVTAYYKSELDGMRKIIEVEIRNIFRQAEVELLRSSMPSEKRHQKCLALQEEGEKQLAIFREITRSSDLDQL